MWYSYAYKYIHLGYLQLIRILDGSSRPSPWKDICPQAVYDTEPWKDFEVVDATTTKNKEIYIQNCVKINIGLSRFWIKYDMSSSKNYNH